MKFVSRSLVDTGKLTEQILRELPSDGSRPRATILLLQGDLGSGKTTFTQALAKILGVKVNLTSPTFVLMKKYPTQHSVFKKLIHIDAYRLSSGKDLLNLGWEELVTNPDNLIVVEWPEQVDDLWTGSEYKLKFKFSDENTREISD